MTDRVAPPRTRTPSPETTAERAERLHDREGRTWSQVAAELGLTRAGLVATIGTERWIARATGERRAGRAGAGRAGGQ